MSLTIVAIPAKDERVWQLSSEKVPHLTILFLDDVDNLKRVTQFVEHAANTMLGRFYLDVKERGVLGDQSADVLFFDTPHAKTLMDFRRSLLGDTEILKAFNRVEQFPKWIPHLTMGYPETPARPDDREYPGIHTVRFDRIGLWTEDYDGKEIPLKTDEVSPELSMADLGREYLEHYGVKGMKWGVIRNRGVALGKAGVKKAYAPSDDAKKSHEIMARAKLGGVRNLNNHEMRMVIQRMELERQYKELYGERQWHNAGKKWVGKFVTDVLRDAAASWISNPFAGGRRSESDFGASRTRVIDGELAGGRRRALGR